MLANDRACTRVTLPNFHGKEGVDGSSPSEGLKSLQISLFCCLIRRCGGSSHGGGQVCADLQVPFEALGSPGRLEGTMREHQPVEGPARWPRTEERETITG
jgi:hypothetical protein